MASDLEPLQGFRDNFWLDMGAHSRLASFCRMRGFVAIGPKYAQELLNSDTRRRVQLLGSAHAR
jgi:hypothetical protein